MNPRGYPRHEPTRKASVKRIKTLLQLKGGEVTEIDQANLGIYGLGDRRTLSDLQAFIGIDMKRRTAGFIDEVSFSKSL